MKKSIYFICFISSIFQLGCLDLDNNLYNPKQTDTYLYEATTLGDFPLPESHAILPNEMTPFQVESDNNGEKAIIEGAFIGDFDQIDKDTVILYCHGNSNHLDYYFKRAQLLYNLKAKSHYSVVIFDYQGYGKSTGRPNETNLITDTYAVVQFLKDRGLDESRLYVYGFSLGSIPAVKICHDADAPLKPVKLMLEAPIGSIDQMGVGGTGLSLSTSFYANLKTNNIEDIKKVNQPLFLIHGEDDTFLSYEQHGKPVYENHTGAYKQLTISSNGTHDDAPFARGLELYLKDIEHFFNKTK